MRKILSVLLAAVMLLALSSSSAEDSPILGNPFPDFTVRTAAQQEFTLSGFPSGKPFLYQSLYPPFSGFR